MTSTVSKKKKNYKFLPKSHVSIEVETKFSWLKKTTQNLSCMLQPKGKPLCLAYAIRSDPKIIVFNEKRCNRRWSEAKTKPHNPNHKSNSNRKIIMIISSNFDDIYTDSTPWKVTLLIAVIYCGLVTAQLRGGRPSGFERDAVILKQAFDSNPDGSYAYKWVFTRLSNRKSLLCNLISFP